MFLMRRHIETITITFGDRAENHKDNQIIGVSAASGLTVEDLEKAKIAFESQKCECELIELNNLLKDSPYKGQAKKATLLIIRQGVRALLDGSNHTADELFQQMRALEWDKKYWDERNNEVRNKKSHHNLCISDIAQEANYSEGKGTIIPFDQIPGLLVVRNNLPHFLGTKATALQGEGNRYYDPGKCYIGWHGDAERKVTIGVRFGRAMPLYYHWFKAGAPIGELLKVNLNHGDVYVMSEKAVGNDWKWSSFLTLRHSAGADQHTVNELRKKKEERGQKEEKKTKKRDRTEEEPEKVI